MLFNDNKNCDNKKDDDDKNDRTGAASSATIDGISTTIIESHA